MLGNNTLSTFYELSGVYYQRMFYHKLQVISGEQEVNLSSFHCSKSNGSICKENLYFSENTFKDTKYGLPYCCRTV